MDIKSFLKTNVGHIVLTCCIAIIACILLLVAILIGLNQYTQHGKEIEVPSVCGFYISEAEVLLEEKGLKLEVIDSTFSHEVPLGAILEQTPKALSKVKEGRTIYLIVNAKSRKMVSLPELRDMSSRQAQSILTTLGLRCDLIYEPSEYKDLVLDMRKDENSLVAGTSLVEGSSLTLVIGQGAGDGTTFIPDLYGKTLEEARVLLLSSSLVVGSVVYNEAQTEDNVFYVFSQDPQVGEMVQEGTHVDLRLSKDPEAAIMVVEKRSEEEEFF